MDKTLFKNYKNEFRDVIHRLHPSKQDITSIHENLSKHLNDDNHIHQQCKLFKSNEEMIETLLKGIAKMDLKHFNRLCASMQNVHTLIDDIELIEMDVYCYDNNIKTDIKEYTLFMSHWMVIENNQKIIVSNDYLSKYTIPIMIECLKTLDYLSIDYIATECKTNCELEEMYYDEE